MQSDRWVNVLLTELYLFYPSFSVFKFFYRADEKESDGYPI